MEEYDELSAGPDEDGRFNLSYNDWTIMPYDRCTGYSNRLIYLNISLNHMEAWTYRKGHTGHTRVPLESD